MYFKKKTMNFGTELLKKGKNIIGRNKTTWLSAILAEKLSPTLAQETDSGVIFFYCPGRLSEWRARTLLTKEPETIEWINTFNNMDVLWDIGANIGVYSLYAALKGLYVLAIEPSPGNYYLLNRNIEINKMDNRVSALCIALNDQTKLDSFYMSNTVLGGASSSFAEAIDWQGNPFTPSFKQAMIGFSIDDFIEQFNPPFPNHIKIDVDGIENKIINGAKSTLSDKRVKSILIELDTESEDYCNEVIKTIEQSGMRFFKKKHAPEFDNSKYSTIFNHIFIRP